MSSINVWEFTYIVILGEFVVTEDPSTNELSCVGYIEDSVRREGYVYLLNQLKNFIVASSTDGNDYTIEMRLPFFLVPTE